MKINIPTPCHENWETMKIDDRGRFCEVCKKKVLDFSNSTDVEISTFFNSSSESVCGNFRENQINSNLQNYSFINGVFIKFAVGFMLTSGGLITINAQDRVAKNDTINIIMHKGKVATTEKQKEPKIMLRGMVTAKDIDSEPLYVLDGKIINKEKMDKIDPNNIERVNVLKGPSATAIYGTSANNGAIIINSKSKKKNKK